MDRHFIIIYNGDMLAFPGNVPVAVGQTLGCDIRLPNHSQYEDTIIAKILPNRNSGGWHLVKTTPYYPISIGGSEMNRVHYLQDGDVIEILGQTLKFNEREGEQHQPNITHINKNSRTVWAVLAAILVVLGILCYQAIDSRRERISKDMIAEIESSIYSTRVDSIHLMKGDSIVESYIYMSSPVGSAFLTEDSMIVTARHCLEPWLNMADQKNISSIPQRSEWPIASAMRVETENQLGEEHDWRMVSYITLTDATGNSRSYTSDDFKINTDFDDIVELGDYDNPKFWRSISHRPTRSNMMLGDIAVAKAEAAGKIPLADKEDLIRLLPHHGETLAFFGHPTTMVGSKPDMRVDQLRAPLEPLAEDSTRLFMLSHDGSLSRGFSGGPVIIRDGFGYRAIGVISVTDESNKTRSYSVPTSEIIFLTGQK